MVGTSLRKPLRVIAAEGQHHALVTCDLEPEAEAKAERVAAFLINYYGNGTALQLRDPMATITTRDRMALVTVTISGTRYVITDIRLRMIRPREAFTAQGFPRDYIIERTADGRRISTTNAMRMCGNSVSPMPIKAIALANTEPMQMALAA